MKEANIVNQSIRALRQRLPPGWKQRTSVRPTGGPRAGDAFFEITGPDGRKAKVLVEAKSRLFPADVAKLKTQLAAYYDGPGLVVANYLSPTTRRTLTEEGLNYLDLTGNVRLVLSRPGLFVESVGASVDPSPEKTGSRSLRGPKAGRLVRALADFPPPLGISDVASRAGINVGYASRLIDLLAREGVLTRAPRGPVEQVDEAGLIRRWAEDYSVTRSNSARSFLDPRGLRNLTANLPKSQFRYAVTGSVAANRWAPIAPARLAMIYVDDDEGAATALGLRPAEAGANVLLLNPFDDVVFDRTTKDKGVVFVAPSQAAVDLLTSPGRGPAEAEAVLKALAQ